MSTTAAPAPILPDWLAHEDEDEQAELRAHGITLEAPTLPPDEAQRDALASTIMRRAWYVEQDIKRHEMAREREMDAIHARYDRIITPLHDKRQGYDQLLDFLASIATFVGKAKSRKVGWGVLGRRKQQPAVTVTDENAVCAIIARDNPDLLAVTFACKLADVDKYLTPAAMASVSFSFPMRDVKAAAIAAAAAGAPLPGVTIEERPDAPYFDIASPLVPEAQ